jgi:hypothetical protein
VLRPFFIINVIATRNHHLSNRCKRFFVTYRFCDCGTGTDSAWRWYLNTFPFTIDGGDVFGTMSISNGSTSSTLIIPLALSSYTLGTFQIQANLLDKRWVRFISGLLVL